VAARASTMKPATLTMNRLTMFANMIATSGRADCVDVRSVEIALTAERPIAVVLLVSWQASAVAMNRLTVFINMMGSGAKLKSVYKHADERTSSIAPGRFIVLEQRPSCLQTLSGEMLVAIMFANIIASVLHH